MSEITHTSSASDAVAGAIHRTPTSIVSETSNNSPFSIHVMGRLSTAVASAGVDADNLPERLPNISLIDALLPASWTSRSSKKDKVRHITRSHASGNTSIPNRKSGLTSKTYTCTTSNLTSLHFPTTPATHYSTSAPHALTMPFIIQPFFRKPFKLFAIDADTNQPVDSNVRKKTRVTYYELQNVSNGSKRLVAHKSASEVAKEAETKPAENADAKSAEELKIDDAQKADDAAAVAWTDEQDKTLKTMKENGKTWVQIATETGKAKHECQARWKEIRPADGEAQGKKDDGGGGNGGQQGKQDKGGDGQGQGHGKKGKKGKGGDNNQNNNQHHNNQQHNKATKPASAKPSKPASAPPAPPAANTNNEARFTMNDWLTLQEDDIFSFGELQCLSELIAKDMNQGWQRVAAKFFDLTGRRVHPDDVREKFESMATVAEGKK
jgi:hypothetical protein